MGMEKFLGLVKKCLAEVPPRKAYYPGAQDRYAKLTTGRGRVEKIGSGGPDGASSVTSIVVASLSRRSAVAVSFCADATAAATSFSMMENGLAR